MIQSASLRLASGFFFLYATILRAQGTFQNLDFEAANVSGYPPNGFNVPIGSALPGWTGKYSSAQFGTNQASQVGYDAISLGSAVITVVDTNAAQYGFGPLAGAFSVVLFGQGLSSPTFTTISQSGLIPNGTHSLQALMAWSGAAPVVTLGGQTLNMIALQTFSGYTLYGADISSLAGQNAVLSFTEPPPSQGTPSSLLLDNIMFSPSSVPEPSGLAVLGLAVLLISRCVS